jgi:hypothetical protein
MSPYFICSDRPSSPRMVLVLTINMQQYINPYSTTNHKGAI